ncbi:porin [Bradyrhizobium diazoefficiens]|uniref:porin n=1 Tax=Bradyrhizobium diazoefficiens TaxID=1355477 RepID=UPI0019097030|nr:porin [Bradyrhizobium diazoefficiens]MBK3662922.1 porin [Bradyrhizobium diazoefficiens]
MKLVKSLLLGSAAGLIAVGGAQAADLPVKAKAVEYVKICSLYGAGFYYIPGTDTCIKLGGYLRAEAAIHANDFNGYFSSTAGAENRLSNYYIVRGREDLNIDTRTATEYGVVRTFADLTFSWTTGNYSGTAGGATGYDVIAGTTSSAPGNSSGGNVAGGALGVYYAFIQFAGFTMGKAVSQFSAPWTNYPANNFDGLVGAGGTVTGVAQFTYTADFGQGMTFALSAQDPTVYYQGGVVNASLATSAGIVGGSLGGSAYGGTRSPDLVAMFRADQAWGLFQASVAAHDNHVAYYGATELTGHPDDKWGWAGQLALSIKNIPTGAGDTINMSGVYANGASYYVFQDLAPHAWSMFGGTSLAGATQSVGFATVTDSVFIPGAGQELTTTYGFAGGYTHNWDPYWNTSLYGSYGAVRYNSTAKGYICGSAGMVGLLTAGSTCNPDFNYWVIGTKTGWTPVKNLTFSADVNYAQIDTKYAGSVAYAGSAGTAKPPGLYEIKNQGTVSLLLRAQRNW